MKKNLNPFLRPNEPMLHENHPMPKTRREFLAQGFFGMGTAYVATPSILSMLVSKAAFGLDCGVAGSGGGNRAPGFLAFDLAGGASIAGSNVIVGKRGGQEDFLANYVTLGLPAAMNPDRPGQVDNQLGLLFHADSAFLRGIVETTTPETRANIEGAVFCTSSSDDTGNNPHNPMFWINGAGASGELVQLLGSRASDSGGRSQVPARSVNPTARPVLINRPEDALSLVNLGKLATMLSPAKAQKVLQAVERMSESQLNKFDQKDFPTQIKELVQCGYINSSDMINKFTPDRLDARTDAQVTAAFGANLTGDASRVATMAKLITDGNAGGATVELGGFDYHNGTRATGEARDLDAGRLMGRALQLAALKGKDLIIYTFSDGSVTSNGQVDNSANGRGKTVWTGDSGQRSASIMLYYRAAGKPKLRDNSVRQIGAFTDAGAVDNGVNKISSNVESLAMAVVANYLAIQGREGELAKVVGTDPFGSDLKQYLVFDKQG